MISQKEKIKFLESFLIKLRKTRDTLNRIARHDLAESENPYPTPSHDDECTRIIANENGFNGELFRDLIPKSENDEVFNFPEWQKGFSELLDKKIHTVADIITKLKNTDESKQGWHIQNGQVFYNGNDLQFPAGQIQEIIVKLIDSESKTILNKELDEIATGKHRHHISTIKKIFKNKNIPYEIQTVYSEGYVLQKKSES